MSFTGRKGFWLHSIVGKQHILSVAMGDNEGGKFLIFTKKKGMLEEEYTFLKVLKRVDGGG